MADSIVGNENWKSQRKDGREIDQRPLKLCNDGADMSNSILNNESPEDSVESLSRAGIFQQWNRVQVDGHDQITGIFRCDFEPLQQRYALNIPIHPALANIPSVEAICLERAARIRKTDCQKFGVRLEVVLSETLNQAQVLFVDVVISSPLVQKTKTPSPDTPSSVP